MKIGLSLSRCIKDIVQGRVNRDDVLIIIARTDFDPTNEIQWKNIWATYSSYNLHSRPEWAELEHDAVYEVVLSLYLDGKIHQPRKFGGSVRRTQYYWLEAVLVPEDLEKNTALSEAWRQFQTLSALTGIALDDQYC